MRHTTTYMGVVLVAAVSAVTAAWAPVQSARAQPLEAVSRDRLAAAGFLVIPYQDVALTADELLEARLAAVVRRAELRPRLDHALINFDVEGLAQGLGAIVEGLDARAQVSVHVRDLQSQHVLFDYYGDSPLNPASNQKLLTSTVALDLLGSDYTFATRVARRGNTLILRGEGDPTLVTEDLTRLAHDTARAVQLAEIDGLVVDATAFSAERFAPGVSADGPGYAYTAPSGALSVDFNTVSILVQPSRGGRGVAVTVTPATPGLQVRNRARRGRKNTLGVRSFEERGRTIIEVTGQLPRNRRGFNLRRRVHDPALHVGQIFAQALSEASASEPLPVTRGELPIGAETVAIHESAPLAEVIDAGLAYSNNFMAEQILRTVAWRLTGDPGSWDTGAALLEGYWTALGNDPGSIVVENASGLSESGRVTSSGLVDLISVAHRTPGVGEGLIDALPVAGEPGTLRTRLRKSGKRVRAKTGTLHGVSGLTGVITRESGEAQLAFSILINAGDAHRLTARRRRSAQDRMVVTVLRYLDAYEARRSGA